MVACLLRRPRDGEPLTVSVSGCAAIEATKTRPSGDVVDERWTLRCPGGLTGRTVAVEGLSRTRAEVIARVRDRGDRARTRILTADDPTWTIDQEPAPPGALAYLPLGIAHILGGPDHLLFVVGLVAVIGRRRRALLLAITAFTLAHSLTLALAVLGIVAAPRRAVEAVIALSLVLLAVELTRPRATLTTRAPWIVALACGLVHGFGFAGALAELGLPADDRAGALALFNVGVELGQLAVIATLWLAAAALRRRVSAPLARALAAYAIGVAGSYWLLDRLLPMLAAVT